MHIWKPLNGGASLNCAKNHSAAWTYGNQRGISEVLLRKIINLLLTNKQWEVEPFNNQYMYNDTFSKCYFWQTLILIFFSYLAQLCRIEPQWNTVSCLSCVYIFQGFSYSNKDSGFFVWFARWIQCISCIYMSFIVPKKHRWEAVLAKIFHFPCSEKKTF